MTSLHAARDWLAAALRRSLAVAVVVIPLAVMAVGVVIILSPDRLTGNAALLGGSGIVFVGILLWVKLRQVSRMLSAQLPNKPRQRTGRRR